jgi:hypothetical protein
VVGRRRFPADKDAGAEIVNITGTTGTAMGYQNIAFPGMTRYGKTGVRCARD